MTRHKTAQTSRRRMIDIRKKQLYHRTWEGISEGYVHGEHLRDGKLRAVHVRMLEAGLPVVTRTSTMTIRAN